jgi:hypothetical protein
MSGNAAPTIPPLKLTPDAARELAGDALQLLTTAPGGNNRPQSLAELYADRIVSVIELHEAKPIWNAQDKSLYTMELIQGLRQEQAAALNRQLCTVQSISDRLGYQTEANPTTAPSP